MSASTAFIFVAGLAVGVFIGVMGAIAVWNPELERMFKEERARNERARIDYLDKINKEEEQILNYEKTLKKIEQKVAEYTKEG